MMLKHKICMVGDFAVGKTSLTQRFVNNTFSEKYLTTIGVKIDNVVIDDAKLIIWDVAGRDTLSPINTNYLSGASGVVLVADGTRSETIDSLESLADIVVNKVGELPIVIAINKCDDPAWSLNDEQKNKISSLNRDYFATSARDGVRVPEMFAQLVEILDQKNGRGLGA